MEAPLPLLPLLAGWLLLAQAQAARAQDTFEARFSNATANLQHVACAPDGRLCVAAGKKGILLASNDGGETWGGREATAKNLWEVSCPTETTCWVAGDARTVLRTTDAGATFANAGTPSGANKRLYAIHAFSADAAWVGDTRGRISKTNDGGATWTTAPAREGVTDTIRAVRCTSEAECLIAQGNEVHRTVDGGATWTAVADLGSLAYDVQSVGGITVAVGKNAAVRCAGAGACESIALPAFEKNMPSFVAVHLVSDAVGYISGTSCRVYRTEDGGLTWTRFHDWGCGTGTMVGVSARLGDCRVVVAAAKGTIEASTGCPAPPPPPSPPPLPPPPPPTAGPPTCAVELRIKDYMGRLTYSRTGPKFIRGVFHDSLDADGNLIDRDGNPPPAGTIRGGVDFCLYAALVDDKADPNHNQGLGRAISKSKLANRKLGISTADALVVGAIVALEHEGKGPRVPMLWGRETGPCPVVSAIGGRNQSDSDYFLKVAPSLRSFDPEVQRTVFEALGYTAAEQAALMGAHSFGNLERCAGGLNGVERGNWCPFRPKRCDLGGGRIMDEGQQEQFCTASNETGVGMVLKKEFGDGSYWDTTPDVFDNEYYKGFAKARFEDNDRCCGRRKQNGETGEFYCHRSGNPVSFATGEALEEGAGLASLCGESRPWCRSDRKGRSHMKSAQVHAIPFSRDYLQRPDLDAAAKRLVLLPPDWALLGREDTKRKVVEYAASQSTFFDEFTAAFLKVTKRGYAEGELKPCTPAPCAANAAGLVTCGDASRLGDGRRRLHADTNAMVNLGSCDVASRIAAGEACALTSATGAGAAISCTPASGGPATTVDCTYICDGDTCEADDEGDAAEEAAAAALVTAEQAVTDQEDAEFALETLCRR